MVENRKMVLKPEQTSASVNVDDLIASAGGAVPPEPKSERKKATEASDSLEGGSSKKRAQKLRIGRPPKDKKQLRGQKITLSLTDAERNALRGHAGMVPEATFVLSILQKAGVLE